MLPVDWSAFQLREDLACLISEGGSAKVIRRYERLLSRASGVPLRRVQDDAVREALYLLGEGGRDV